MTRRFLSNRLATDTGPGKITGSETYTERKRFQGRRQTNDAHSPSHGRCGQYDQKNVWNLGLLFRLCWSAKIHRLERIFGDIQKQSHFFLQYQYPAHSSDYKRTKHTTTKTENEQHQQYRKDHRTYQSPTRERIQYFHLFTQERRI